MHTDEAIRHVGGGLEIFRFFFFFPKSFKAVKLLSFLSSSRSFPLRFTHHHLVCVYVCLCVSAHKGDNNTTYIFADSCHVRKDSNVLRILFHSSFTLPQQRP